MYRGNEKYYNYTANEADEEREHRLSTLQKWRSGNARSLQYNYLLRCNEGSNSYTICTMHVKFVDCTWMLTSCKLASFIFTCVSDGVRHDVIQSFDVTAHFLFLGNIRLKAISHQWPGWLVYSSSTKQCLLPVNLKQFLMQMKQNSTKNPCRRRFDTEKPLERERRLEIQRKQRRRRWRQQTARSRKNITQWISNAKVILRANWSDFG